MHKETAKRTPGNKDSEFDDLFWAARKEQNILKERASAKDTNHSSAVGFAEARAWEWAKALIEASRLDRIGDPDKALQLLTETQMAVPDQWQGLLNFVRGSAFQTKGEHDEAIKAYRKATEDPMFSKPAYVWHNLGNSFLAKGEYDKAIDTYHKALDSGIGSPGIAWNAIGIGLSRKGEHDEAIKAYRKAIEDPNYDTPGHAWNNLGNALAVKGDYQEAISTYRKALEDPKHETPAKAWTNLAETYLKSGQRNEAEKAFEKALTCPARRSSDYARARRGLQILKSNIAPDALSPDDRAMVAKPAADTATDEIESGIIAAINEAGDTQYEKYIGKPDSTRDDTLSILRGWSSAVTLLEGSERRWRGGGYFLKWRGFGIVIDPGFDFLRNFHDAGYHGREIHMVVVSHNHPDHNSDLKDIDDLRYELFKRLAATKKSGGRPYALVWDEDTGGATKFGIDKPQHHYPPIVMSSGFPLPFDLRKHEAKVPVRIIPFNVKHGNDVPHAMGMVVELLNNDRKTALRIGYTADTAYFPELHQRLLDCDVLIAHISQPSIEELRDASKLKEAHLGYRGTARLLKECNPKLALIGEFWAGFTDLRIPLVKGLRRLSGVNTVLPAGLAMHLRLPSLKIECTECKNPTLYSEIKVAPPPDNFGSLAYLCPDCMIG